MSMVVGSNRMSNNSRIRSNLKVHICKGNDCIASI